MDTETEYQETLKYLYSFIDYSLTHDLRNLPDKFDLERMRSFMAELGHPEQSYPIIHVAGTKGKGSVCAFCASVLMAAGYQTGLYTSPHLQDYAERIQFNGKPIGHSELVELVNTIRPLLDNGTKMTTFEITTALAFSYFAKNQAQAVVAEVGLGGRLDATNIVKPVVTVITSISYDHIQVLGNTLSEIAFEKAGIIDPEIPVVVAPQKTEALNVIEEIAAKRGAPMTLIGRDYQFTPLDNKLEGQTLEVWNTHDAEQNNPIELFIPLLGEHQIENAVTAYAALQIANEHGLALTKHEIQQGFASVSWPARFEVLRRDPPVIVDCAHNRDSAHRLSETIRKYFSGWPIILVFGASEEKDIAGMLDEFKDDIEEIIFTRSYHPRAIEPQALITWATEIGKPAQIIPKVEDALEKALEIAGNNKLVLFTGSIFIAAGARDTWYNRTTPPQPV